MEKIYLIGFIYKDNPNFPFLTLPECGFWFEQSKAQTECDRRNKVESEMANEPKKHPGFIQGYWSVRECAEN